MVENLFGISSKIRQLYEQPTAGHVISMAANLLRGEGTPTKRTVLWRNPDFRTIVSAALAGSDEHLAARLKELNDTRNASV